MTEKVRVLHVLRQASGGMRNHVTTLLKKMDKSRYTLMVACPRNTIVDSELIASGVKIFYVDICEGSSVMDNLRCLRRLMQIIRQNKVQIVHSHGARAGILGRIAALLTRTPVSLCTVHNFVAHSNVSGWKKWVYLIGQRILESATTRYITVSNALAEEIALKEGISPDKIDVVYNGIDLDNFNVMLDCTEKKNQLGLSPNAVIIGTGGRLIATKGVSYFIQAARLVKDKFPLTQFIIVGDGPERSALERLAIRIGMEDHIKFLGYRRDLMSILPLINIFVVPSLSEGQSIITLEAMAARRPIVAFETGGIPELLQHMSSGLLVSEKGSKPLARGIIEILQNPLLGEKLGNRARMAVEQKFRQETMVKKTEEIYRQCLEEKGFNREPVYGVVR